MPEIGRTMDSTGGEAGPDGPGPRLMSADTLQGDEVYNAADEKLGEITDIMIDVPTAWAAGARPHRARRLRLVTGHGAATNLLRPVR